MRVNLYKHTLGNGFLYITPKAQATTEKLNWTSLKHQNFLLRKTPLRK